MRHLKFSALAGPNPRTPTGRTVIRSLLFQPSGNATVGGNLEVVALPFGTFGGGWVVDARPGVITFFQYANVTGVGESNPIYASFYRFVGPTGVSGVRKIELFYI